jgi:hypothetical protein
MKLGLLADIHEHTRQLQDTKPFGGKSDALMFALESIFRRIADNTVWSN